MKNFIPIPLYCKINIKNQSFVLVRTKKFPKGCYVLDLRDGTYGVSDGVYSGRCAVKAEEALTGAEGVELKYLLKIVPSNLFYRCRNFLLRHLDKLQQNTRSSYA